MSLRTCRQGHAIPIHTLLTPFSLSHTYNHNCSIITRFRTFRLDHHRRKDGRTDGRTNRPTVRRFSKSKLGSRIGLGQTRNKRMVQNGIRSIQIFVCPFYKTRPSVRTFESLACSFIRRHRTSQLVGKLVSWSVDEIVTWMVGKLVGWWHDRWVGWLVR